MMTIFLLLLLSSMYFDVVLVYYRGLATSGLCSADEQMTVDRHKKGHEINHGA